MNNTINNQYTEENYKRVCNLQNTFFDIFEIEKEYLTDIERIEFRKIICDLLQESKEIEKELDKQFFLLNEIRNENNCYSCGDL